MAVALEGGLFPADRFQEPLVFFLDIGPFLRPKLERRSHDIGSIAEDRNGDLWIGTGNGAARVARDGFTTYGEQDGLTYIVYHAYRLSDGTPACSAQPSDNNRRHTLIDRVTIENDWPHVSSNL